jgi:hypothetical protein
VIEEVFRGLQDEVKVGILGALAEDIDHIASSHNDRWGVTVLPWGFRLNVGWVNCFIVSPQGLLLLLEVASAPAGAKLDGSNYDRAPGCELASVSFADAPSALPVLRGSHVAALDIAARWFSPPNIRRGHSTGLTKFLSHTLGRPVSNPSYAPVETQPQFWEGGQISALVTCYERDQQARQVCIAHFGSSCSVCEMSFAQRYGDGVKGFIHVHHLVPLAQIDDRYAVDPIADLRPVCPNCHAVIHSRVPPLGIDEARALLAR